jgi:hypothetical protein
MDPNTLIESVAEDLRIPSIQIGEKEGYTMNKTNTSSSTPSDLIEI